MAIKYGIAFTVGGHKDTPTCGWLKDYKGEVLLFDTMDDALEANDHTGWTGYVREYKPVNARKIVIDVS